MALDCKEYIKYIKSKPCTVCGDINVDAHHMDTIGMGGNRKLPTNKDYSCVPLCRKHHQEWHQIGNEKFREKYREDLWKMVYWCMREWFCE